MSTEVESRVVSIEFDNSKFETKMNKTLSLLDKFKEKINIPTKNLDNVSKSAKNVDLSPLTKQADSVAVKFKAMDVAVTTVLVNITNSAINAGKKIASALTIDPIISGFSEYETKINAIQTIMSNTASKGTTMSDVTRVIDELNTYADKTIYNFAEMTRNIGTFTAAGVGLQDSASAIQGIANLAAASGSNSQQASTAMYQLSQALAAGSVKLMDWNSVVNAGMGGEKFQEALKATAREYGTNVDQMIKDNGSFRESLQEGWITADVLNTTLKKFTTDGARDYAKSMVASGKYTQAQADALMAESIAMEDAATKIKTFTQLIDTLKESLQSGWGKSWEIIIGDFEEAKELFTEVSDALGGIIGESSDARNNLLTGGLTSGWDLFLSAGIPNEYRLIEEITKLAEGQGIAINDLVKEHGSFEKALKSGFLSNDLLAGGVDNLTTSMLELSEAELKASGYSLEQIHQLKTFNEMIKDGSVDLNDFTKIMTQQSGRENLIQALRNSFVALGNIVTPVKEALTTVFPPATADQLYNITVAIEKFTKSLIISEEDMEDVRITAQAVFTVLKWISNIATGGLKIGLTLIGKLFNISADSALDLTSNLGQMVLNIDKMIDKFDIVGISIDYAVEAIKAGVGIAKNWIGEFAEIPQVSEAISNITSDFRIFKSSVSDVIYPISNTISQLKDIENIDAKTIFEKISTSIKNSLDNIKNMNVSFDGTKKALETLKENTKTILSSIGDGFTSLTDGVKENLENIKAFIQKYSTEILAIGAGLIIFAIGKNVLSIAGKIGDAMELLTAPLEGVSTVLESVAGMVDGVTDVLGSYQNKIRADTIKTIAISVAILAGSIALLTFLDHDKIWTSVGVLAALSVVLVALSASFKFLPATDMGKLTVTLIAVATSVLILTLALDKLADLSFVDVLKSIGSLILIGGSLVILARLLTTVRRPLQLGSISLIAISAAIYLMVSTLKKIDSTNIVNVGKTITVMIGIMASLYILAKAASKISFKSAAGLITLVGSLHLMLSAVEKITNINPENIKQSITNFIAIFGMMGILIAASNLAGKHAIKAGAMILAISAAMVLMTATIHLIKDINKSDLSKATSNIMSIMLIFGLVIAASNLAGKHAAKAGLMLIGMSAALILMTGSILLLAVIKDNELERAIKAIQSIGLIMTLLMLGSQFSGGSVASIIALAGGIAILAGTVALLTLVDQDKLKTSTNALSMLMGMLTLLVASGKYVGKSSLLIIPLALVVGGLAGILYMMQDLDADKAIKNAASLSMLLLSLSGSIGILALVGLGGWAGIIGIGVMVATIAAMGLLIAGIAYLNTQFPDLEEFMAKGLPMFEMIGKSIGLFLGGIVGGIATGATNDLTSIGENLSNFITSLQPFLTGVSNIDEGVANGAESIAKAILYFTAADVMTGLTKFLGGSSSLNEFAEQLAPFGEAMVEFANITKGIDGAAIEQSANAAMMISEFAKNVPNSGGLAGWFAGENDLSMFATQLVPFGEALVAFSGSVTGLNETSLDKIKMVSEAAGYLIDMASDVPNTGGVAAWFAGDNDLTTFANDLYGFGLAVSTLSLLGGVGQGTIDMINHLAGIISTISTVTADIPNTGGVASWFAGDNDLSGFATQISEFAIELSTIKEVNIPSNLLNNIATSTMGITTLATTLSLIDISDIGYFGENIKDFVKDISKITEDAAEIDSTSINNIANVILTISKAITEGMTDDTVKYADAAQAVIESLTTALKSESDNQKTELYNTMKDNGGHIMDGLVVGIKNKKGNVVRAMEEVSQDARNAFEEDNDINSPAGEYIKDGEFIDEGIVEGLNNGRQSVMDTISNISSKAQDTFTEGMDGIGSLGGDVMTGLSDSMSAGTSSAASTAYNSTSEVTQASMDALEEYKVYLEEEQFYGRIDTATELEGWQNLQTMYAEGTEARKEIDREVFTASNKLREEEYAADKKYIEQQKELNDLGLQSEIDMYKQLQTLYVEDVDIQTELADKIFDLEQQLVEDRIQLEEDLADAKQKSIDDRVEKEEEYARETARIQEQLASDIASAQSEYDNALESRTNSIYGSFGLFDQVDGFGEFSPDALIENLESQVGALDNWDLQLDNLSARGVDEALIEELQNMGVSSTGQLEALNSMTDEQLQQFENLWQEKHTISDSRATQELEQLNQDTQDKIRDLNNTAEAELSEYRATWAAEMETLRVENQLAIDAILADLSKLTGEEIEGYTVEGQSIVENVEIIAEQGQNEMLNGTVDWENTGEEIVQNMNDGIKSQETASEQTFVSLVSSMLTMVKNKYSDFYQSGQYLVEGFANGIDDNSWIAERAARNMARAAAEAAEEELDEHSPSRVGHEIGDFFGVGFANGIIANLQSAKNAGISIAQNASQGLDSAIKLITDRLNTDMNLRPVISPVVDLDNFNTGLKTIDTSFASQRAFGVKRSIDKVNKEKDSVSEIQNGTNNPGNNTIINFTQNNNSPKALSAIEIYRQTKNQLSQLKNKGGVTT